mgnify:CR=1 FL=1
MYLLVSGRNGTLYVGVTSNLLTRVWVHMQGLDDDFITRDGVHASAWYEVHESIDSAIHREKAIKEWKRRWKLEEIEKTNSRGGPCTRNSCKDLDSGLLRNDGGELTHGKPGRTSLLFDSN